MELNGSVMNIKRMGTIRQAVRMFISRSHRKMRILHILNMNSPICLPSRTRELVFLPIKIIRISNITGSPLLRTVPCDRFLNVLYSILTCGSTKVRLASAQLFSRSAPATMMEATVTEQTAIETSVQAAPHKGKFFLVDASYLGSGRVSGIEIANEEKLIHPGMNVVSSPNGIPDQYPERPHLLHVPDKGGMPRDLEELAGIWILSEPLKQVFEQMDAEAFAFVACDFSLADGSPGPQYYLGNVLRRIDALDETASRVKITLDHNYQTGQDEKLYSLVGGASLVFKQDVVGEAHIFHQERMGAPPVCDRAMFDALSAANFSGLRLRDVADI
ncbi:uncharacterized protein DUF1629 [Pseudochrobactrum asaccharolyticum]|uniref:Uncharacterized protein DUF1629 n=1 Tax=Pseudochrobactrum asaccharolyticum TaxID=354351 RepID=A0A366DSS1_9HYPH|nr:uncharacterized protein DUF1629 [Pseudochrobactrum asaccharolyticum]